MNSILINPTPNQSDNAPVDPRVLDEWEQSVRCNLPHEYRAFLSRFNGGMLKPWMFRHTHPEIDESERSALLNHLYDWQTVVKKSEFGLSPRMATQPPRHLEIGRDPGGARVLLSLDEPAHGIVVYWLPSHSDWGSEPNRMVGFIAPSFQAFLDGLYDDGETRHPSWDVVARKRPPVPLVL